jgi:peroxiredoxin
LESANGSRATLSYKNVGQKAPTAPFADADGQAVTLVDFAGKPLLLNV